jgi:hypothetical protein
MRRVAAASTATLILVLALAAGSATADPLNKPAYIVDCGGTLYFAVSPDNAAAGSDVNSTSELVVVGGGVPQRLLTFCTATPVGGGESFSAYFLITPPGKT